MPWSQNVNLLLGFLRLASMFLIGVLLLNPLLKHTRTTVDKPILIFAIDNSESVAMRANPDSLLQLQSWLNTGIESLAAKFEVGAYTLSGSFADSLAFDQPTTNLNDLLSNVQSAYEGERVVGVVLLSDGIVNEGALPQYRNYTYPIYTVGLGDTIAPKDFGIEEVRSNEIAYQGNKFPVRIKVIQKGFDGVSAQVSISEGKTLLAEKNIVLDKSIVDIDFELEAKEAGLKRLQVRISRLEGESTYLNNQKDIYLNVVEGKEKILILAPAPHPDISAIRSVLATAPNYESDIYISSIAKGDIDKKYDVVIEFNAFSGVKYPVVKSTGHWYFLGSRSMPKVNQELSYFKIVQRGRQNDNVRPVYQDSFSKFKLNSENLDALEQYPPIVVPFADYRMSGPTEVLITQGVGSVDTGKPLMMYYDDGKTKAAITSGSGIWQWKLQEAGMSDKSPLFDEIVMKTIQLLSVKSDKKQFVVKPRQSIFNANERVFLDVEIYNDIYERTHNNTVSLNLTNEVGEVQSAKLVDSPSNSTFNLGRLPAGLFKYKAVTKYANKTLVESGEFLVRAIQIEALALQADHDLMRALSEKSGGVFYDFSDHNELLLALNSKEVKGTVRAEEDLFPLVSSLWLIGLIMFLLTIEWGLRKYLGAY